MTARSLWRACASPSPDSWPIWLAIALSCWALALAAAVTALALAL